jgi:hypothetical protein
MSPTPNSCTLPSYAPRQKATLLPDNRRDFISVEVYQGAIPAQGWLWLPTNCTSVASCVPGTLTLLDSGQKAHIKNIRRCGDHYHFSWI